MTKTTPPCDGGRHAIESCDLAVGYRGTVVLSGMSVKIDAGAVTVLIGPNGAGKSTVLKTMARQLEPIGGTVYLEGAELAGIPAVELARSLALVTTERFEIEFATCRDVVASGRAPYTGMLGLLTDEDRKAIEDALGDVHATDLADRLFSELSDGQRQRILLARGLCQKPRILILDEPTSFLDVRHKLEIMEIVTELAHRRGIAVLMSLHELDLAEKVADRVICIEGEAIGRVGTPDEIFQGSYISELYGIVHGSFNELYGSVELAAPSGEPRVFVIGGSAAAIREYRALARAGVPFAAGILRENEVDVPVARALAAKVVAVPAHGPATEEAFSQAQELVEVCDRVVVRTEGFGAYNEENRRLAEMAAQAGKLDPDDARAMGWRLDG